MGIITKDSAEFFAWTGPKESIPFFLSFFLWFGRPEPITGLSGFEDFEHPIPLPIRRENSM